MTAVLEEVETKYTLKIEHDESPENPLVNDSWEWINFDGRLINSREARDLLTVNKDGEVTAVEVGLRRKLACGTAFLIECYEHGGRAYSLRGEATYRCQWDTTDVAALLVWLGKPTDIGKDFAARKENARLTVETYGAWANGEVYGYSLESADGTIDDSCWGFYGNDIEYMLWEVRASLPAGTTEDEIEVEGDSAWLLQYHPLFPVEKKQTAR